MATYYGYVQREADSYVNWAEAAKGMTDMLETQNKIREEKKTEIDNNSRELSQFLTDNPLGDSKTLSDYSMQLAGNSQDYLLNLNKLLKSGKLRMNDYLTRVQNLKDSTTQTYGILKSYQDRAKEVKERRAKGDSSVLEEQVFQEIEGFSDFANSYAYINPETGVVWHGKMEKQIGPDGKEFYAPPKTPSGNLQPTYLLKKRMMTNYDKFKMDDEVKSLVGTFGDQIHIIEMQAASTKRPGLFKEVMDPMNREPLKNLPESMKASVKSMQDAEGKAIDAILTDPFKTSSIVLDYLRTPEGGVYGVTYDENEAKRDPSKVLLRQQNNGIVPDFTTENGKKQYQAAHDAIRLRMRMAYKYDEKLQQTSQHQSPSSGRGGGGGKKGQSSDTEPQAPEGDITTQSTGGEEFDKQAMAGDIYKIMQNNVGEKAPKTTAANLTKYLADYGITANPVSGGIFQDDVVELVGNEGKRITFNIDNWGQVPWDDLTNFVIENGDKEMMIGKYPIQKTAPAQKQKPGAKGSKNP